MNKWKTTRMKNVLDRVLFLQNLYCLVNRLKNVDPSCLIMNNEVGQFGVIVHKAEVIDSDQ